MSKMNNAELREKIKLKQPFIIPSTDERKRALLVASILDIPIVTRACKDGQKGFKVQFLPTDQTV